jgi:hypothetical protein
VNFKSVFEGGVPGETYGQGVRRRAKSIGIIWGLSLVSLLVTYGVYALSASIWATLGVASVCGIIGSRADLGLDPPKGAAPNESDKRIWLILFVPALLLFGGVSIYSAIHAQGGLDVFKAALTAGLFGWLLGSTSAILLSADSRARVEGTTFTTSAGKNP